MKPATVYVETREPLPPVVRHPHRESMDQLLRDFRLGLRSLIKRPALFSIATISLALGISANTTIFAAIDGFMLTPLPYPDANRILQLWTTNPQRGWNRVSHVDAGLSRLGARVEVDGHRGVHRRQLQSGGGGSSRTGAGRVG